MELLGFWIPREIIGIITIHTDASSYRHLRQTTKLIKTFVDKALPPLRAKSKFTTRITRIDKFEEITEDVLPCGIANGKRFIHYTNYREEFVFMGETLLSGMSGVRGTYGRPNFSTFDCIFQLTNNANNHLSISYDSEWLSFTLSAVYRGFFVREVEVGSRYKIMIYKYGVDSDPIGYVMLDTTISKTIFWRAFYDELVVFGLLVEHFDCVLLFFTT